MALAYWPVVVGETVAERTRPVMLLGKRLVVEVDSLVWRRLLARLSRTIAAKLNRAIGRAIVEHIDFRVAAPISTGMGRGPWAPTRKASTRFKALDRPVRRMPLLE